MRLKVLIPVLKPSSWPMKDSQDASLPFVLLHIHHCVLGLKEELKVSLEMGKATIF